MKFLDRSILINCKIEISEALLNKAGICWTNTPVSNTFEEILIYTR